MIGDACRICDILKEMYGQKFGGKEKGRYRISRSNLRKLMVINRLYDRDVEMIRDEMFQAGFTFLDHEDYFVVIESRTVGNYRRVTKKMVKYHTEETVNER
jgi:hypothetical protein